MKKKNRQASISTLAALLVLGVFAVGILSVLLAGANAYQRLTQRDQLAYDSRTCVQYVAAKVRQAPSPDAVALTSFGEGDALVITQVIDGLEYQTHVYCCDGWLMELFSETDSGMEPEDGEQILPLQSLTLTMTGDLLHVELVDGNGTGSSIMLNLRGREGAAYEK